jgi:hypothetical protein
MHDEQMRRRPYHRNRSEVGCRIVRQLPIKTLIDGLRSISANKQGVAVGFGARGFGCGEIAAGAKFVFHHHRLAECRLELLGQQPCREIGASTRRKRDHDSDGLAGPILRERRNRQSLAGGGRNGQNQTAAIDRHAFSWRGVRSPIACRIVRVWLRSNTSEKSTATLSGLVAALSRL